MKFNQGRFVFIVIFVIGFMALSFGALLMAISTWLGPGDAGDPPITPAQEIISTVGHAIINILWFPMFAIHKLFFRGGPLPMNDFIWIIGCGIFYAFLALFIRERVIKRHK